MKKIMLVVVAALALTAMVALAGCKPASHGYTFDCGSFNAEGKTVTIELQGNPSTGYEWTEEKTGDALVWQTTDYAESGKADEVGKGGTYTYTYEGEKAGTTKLYFTYTRSFDPSEDDLTVYVEVTTDASGNVTESKTECSDGSGGSSSK